MKNLVLTVFFTLFLFVSCNHEDLSDTFKIGFNEEFQHGIINQSDDNTLKFSITEINNSRCPSDVVCVWEGKADVKIEIESPLKENIILNTYNNPIDTFDTYSFELIDVSPYPISVQTIKLENFKVTLKIEELNN